MEQNRPAREAKRRVKVKCDECGASRIISGNYYRTKINKKFYCKPCGDLKWKLIPEGIERYYEVRKMSRAHQRSTK